MDLIDVREMPADSDASGLKQIAEKALTAAKDWKDRKELTEERCVALQLNHDALAKEVKELKAAMATYKLAPSSSKSSSTTASTSALDEQCNR